MRMEAFGLSSTGRFTTTSNFDPGCNPKGISSAQTPDTEVIVHLYEEVGEECFSQLRGMFAIALWDRRRKQGDLGAGSHREKTAVLFPPRLPSRLRIGVEGDRGRRRSKPGSGRHRSRGLFHLPLHPSSEKYLPRTCGKVPAAHYIVFSEEGARQHCYWDLRFNEVESRSEGEWCEAVREALMEAVRVRLMSEVPLGSFLSGGMDSSIVVACMARLLDRPVAACSIGFEEERYSEVQHAQTRSSAPCGRLPSNDGSSECNSDRRVACLALR